MNKKVLSGFPCTNSWSALKPGVSPDIETDIGFKLRSLTAHDNAQTQIATNHNYSQTFERDEFDGILINKSEVSFVFVLVIYFILFLFLFILLYLFIYLCYSYDISGGEFMDNKQFRGILHPVFI